jgi:MinD-like ATPase involved in chromosome partitioning or flagellar assembly
LLTSSEPRDLLESYGIAKLLRAASSDARIGVSVHGARRKGEAAAAFDRLADVSRRRLDLSLASYGQLVDDIQVYRAIVAQRPIGLIHPQSPAARSLSDVAELLLADAGVDSSG